MRNEQLLALIEAGVLEMASGPQPAVRIDEERSQFALHTRSGGVTEVVRLDALVLARRAAFSPETIDDDFIRKLLKRGTVRPYYSGSFHPGGIDIDCAGHPISRTGNVVSNVWASGSLVEGQRYVTDPMPNADRCVRELFSVITERARSRCGTIL